MEIRNWDKSNDILGESIKIETQEIVPRIDMLNVHTHIQYEIVYACQFQIWCYFTAFGTYAQHNRHLYCRRAELFDTGDLEYIRIIVGNYRCSFLLFICASLCLSVILSYRLFWLCHRIVNIVFDMRIKKNVSNVINVIKSLEVIKYKIQ